MIENVYWKTKVPAHTKFFILLSAFFALGYATFRVVSVISNDSLYSDTLIYCICAAAIWIFYAVGVIFWHSYICSLMMFIQMAYYLLSEIDNVVWAFRYQGAKLNLLDPNLLSEAVCTIIFLLGWIFALKAHRMRRTFNMETIPSGRNFRMILGDIGAILYFVVTVISALVSLNSSGLMPSFVANIVAYALLMFILIHSKTVSSIGATIVLIAGELLGTGDTIINSGKTFAAWLATEGNLQVSPFGNIMIYIIALDVAAIVLLVIGLFGTSKFRSKKLRHVYL